MGRTKKLDLSPLGRLNAALPPGITAFMKQTGPLKVGLFYTVITSYVDPLGRQIKVNLGTFADMVQAIKTLSTWKTEQMLKNLPLHIAKQALEEANQEREKIVDGLQQLGTTEQEVSLGNSTMLAVLDRTPFHLIPAEGEMKLDDGTIIPAYVIAGWFKRFEESASQSRMGASSHCGNGSGDDNSNSMKESEVEWSEEALAEFRRLQEGTE